MKQNFVWIAPVFLQKNIKIYSQKLWPTYWGNKHVRIIYWGLKKEAQGGKNDSASTGLNLRANGVALCWLVERLQV